MSQAGKKVKSLSMKHNASKIKSNNISSKGSSSHFNSFFSLSVSNLEENKDDSLLGSDCDVKDMPYQDESDLFKFPNKKYQETKIPVKNYVISGTSSSSEENKFIETDNNIEEETIDFSLESRCLKTKPDNMFNDTTLIPDGMVDKEYNKCDSPNVTNQKEMPKPKIVSNASTVLDDDILIPRTKVNKNPPIEKDTLVNNSETEDSDQCPICLKTVSKYLSHMKSCAAKNNLSTKQLLSAINLHKKQLAERKELGLEIPVHSFRAKVSPKRTRANDKKGPVDSSLQLALALSASLQSAEEDELIQEAEALKEAGLCEEAEQKLSTLEKYGFASALPTTIRAARGSSKSTILKPSLLLKRTREDRERIITEKVAIILINEDENVSESTFTEKEFMMKSKLLKNIWDRDSGLWSKACCGADVQREVFYVQTLAEFVTPSKCKVGESMKRLSQLAGRLNTPVEAKSPQPSTPPQVSCSRETLYNMDIVSTIGKSSKNSTTTTTTQKLSKDWLALVGNPLFSDIEIQCRNNVAVPAHRLVFHVRCPHVLESVVKLEDNKGFVECNDSSRDSVLTFLEFVYSGSINKAASFTAENLLTVSKLADRFCCPDLTNYLKIRSCNTDEPKTDVRRSLFQTNLDSESGLDINSISTTKETSAESDCKSIRSPQNVDLCNSNNRRGSTDMFSESNCMEYDVSTQGRRENLDILASLIEKTSEVEVSPDKVIVENTNETDDIFPLNSSPDITVLKTLPVKRKAQSFSLSDDENISLSKRVCSDISQSSFSLNLNKDEVFDLTQCSNSSTEETSHKENFINKDVTLDENSMDKYDDYECTNVLTQVYRSPLNSFKDVESQDSRDEGGHHDYIDPVWDGFDDDNLHFNYDFSTPLKNKSVVCSLEKSPLIEQTTNSQFNDESNSKYNSTTITKTSLKSTCNMSIGNSPESTLSLSPKTSFSIKHVSYDNKSTEHSSQKTNSPLCKASFNDIFISSGSKSPKNMSQRTLDIYSPQSKIIDKETTHPLNSDSDVEFIEPVCLPESQSSNNNKLRRNLSSQFNFSPDKVRLDSPESLISQKSSSHSSPTGLPGTSGRFSQHYKDKIPKTPLKRDSLAAMQRLLDDSLEISDSVFKTADDVLASDAAGCRNNEATDNRSSTPNQVQCTGGAKGKKPLMTPSPGIIVSDDVTPLADYSSMKTPALKKELNRFGLKPSLGRSKAKLLLRYIYDQTHPLVEEPGGFKAPEERLPRSPVKSPQKSQKQVNLLDSESDSEEMFSQRSTSSSVSSTLTVPEESFNEPDLLSDDLISSQDLSATEDLRTSVRSLILSNKELHRKILLYEPIYLEEFMAYLKDNGVKSKPNAVMDILDEQCITFRTTSWKATNEKRKLKRKSPKKRVKDINSKDVNQTDVAIATNKSISSPIKVKSNDVKKKGRPRKTQT